jgi:hypothetical protein
VNGECVARGRTTRSVTHSLTHQQQQAGSSRSSLSLCSGSSPDGSDRVTLPMPLPGISLSVLGLLRNH